MELLPFLNVKPIDRRLQFLIKMTTDIQSTLQSSSSFDIVQNAWTTCTMTQAKVSEHEIGCFGVDARPLLLPHLEDVRGGRTVCQAITKLEKNIHPPPKDFVHLLICIVSAFFDTSNEKRTMDTYLSKIISIMMGNKMLFSTF